jgi:hypothetical protein
LPEPTKDAADLENQYSSYDRIIQSLKNKATLKVEVLDHLQNAFNILRGSLKTLETDLLQKMSRVDDRVAIKFRDRGEFDLELKISDDIVMFSKHTDAYIFPESHPIWKTAYVQNDRGNAYCGMISIYNFLTDSLRYNRMNDQGVLIARIFINHENHFFVEGKKHLGMLYNNFESMVMTPESMRSVMEQAILYCLEFDIITPSFDQVRIITVQEILEKSLSSVVSTGKRLGFRLQSDDDPVQ